LHFQFKNVIYHSLTGCCVFQYYDVLLCYHNGLTVKSD